MILLQLTDILLQNKSSQKGFFFQTDSSYQRAERTKW